MKPLTKLVSLGVLLLLSQFSSGGEGRQVVLVCVNGCFAQKLSLVELRKLYLGFQVERDGHFVKAYINHSDKKLDQVFLQSIAGMSKKSYQQKILLNKMKFAIAQPATVDSPQRLVALLRTDEPAVSYMWREQAEQFADIQIMQVLWQK